MPDEYWENLQEIFHTARALAPEERSSYLEQVCVDDFSMLRVVQLLLESDEKPGNFLDSPVHAAAAEMIADGQQFNPGQTVGHYEILKRIGKGGMGEVYLGRDTKLKRKVALKFLPGYLTNNAQRLRRFQQEAHGASALSHQNVCTIYEVGESDDGQRFIAMEYIEGMTLRERLSAAQISITEALDISAQIAAALSWSD